MMAGQAIPEHGASDPERLDYARQEAPRMRRRREGGPAPLRRNKEVEEVSAGVGQAVVQRPRVFYRREPELQPFVVAKSGGRAASPQDR